MVTKEQFINGVQRYIDDELISKISGLSKWALALGLGAYLPQVNKMLDDNHNMLVGAGYMQEDGMICIDKVYNDIMQIARKTGSVTQNIPLIGDVTFTETDLTSMYHHIIG